MRLILIGLLLAIVGTSPSVARSPSAGLRTVEQARAAFSNKTQMTFSAGHGTQVEFLRQDGAAFLFYPGNTIVLPGHWKLEQGSGKPMMCFQYGPNSYNPVTHQSGGGWECADVARYATGIVDSVAGDALGLAKAGKVPFTLPRTRTTIARLQKGPTSAPSAAASAPQLSIPQQCEAIIKNANGSRSDMMQAGMLYYHGMQMGQKCVEVDYVKAFKLLRQAGDGRDFASLLADLKLNAASGNPKAIAALRKIDVSPFTR